MPHASDVQPTSHDRHDTMLVAALAAGDLAATDRDQAITLTASCADCASLHDDLVAIARATAVVPPPISAHNRDFRLTPADAARLQPGGWRRLVAAFGAPRLTIVRPLGVGLTTLGLVGLLIGNVSLGLGGSPAAGARVESVTTQDNGAVPRAAASAAAPAMAASDGPGAVSVSGPGASMAPAATTLPDAALSSGGAPGGSTREPDIAGEYAAASDATKGVPSNATLLSGERLDATATADPFQPLNLLFIIAVVLGLALLVASRIRSRPSA